MEVDNYLPLGFVCRRLMQLKVVPSDSRCSCGKPLEAKEEQKNPPTQLGYHALPLASFCRGMLIWCCENSWNYLGRLYIIPEKWVHLGHSVSVFCKCLFCSYHRANFKRFCEEMDYSKSYSVIVTVFEKQSQQIPKCRCIDRKGHCFLIHFLWLVICDSRFQNVALGYCTKEI